MHPNVKVVSNLLKNRLWRVSHQSHDKFVVPCDDFQQNRKSKIAPEGRENSYPSIWHEKKTLVLCPEGTSGHKSSRDFFV